MKISVPGSSCITASCICAALDIDAAHAGRSAQVYRPAYQNDLGAALARGLRNRIAHLSGTAVADEAHRIDALARRTGGDQHLAAEQWTICGQDAERGRGDVVRFHHAAFAGLAAGLAAAVRTEHVHAARAQLRDVGLGRGVGPHLPVHRRRDRHRRRARKTQCRQQVVGHPMRKVRDEIGRGRRDDDQVGPARQLDMAHRTLCVLVPQVAAHLATGNGLERQRRNELARAGGHHDLYLGAALDQAAHQVRALVGGDAAGDAQQDSFCTHRGIIRCRKRSFP
jgi:hypothetical protein